MNEVPHRFIGRDRRRCPQPAALVPRYTVVPRNGRPTSWTAGRQSTTTPRSSLPPTAASPVDRTRARSASPACAGRGRLVRQHRRTDRVHRGHLVEIPRPISDRGVGERRPATFDAIGVLPSAPALVPRYTLYPVTADPPLDAAQSTTTPRSRCPPQQPAPSAHQAPSARPAGSRTTSFDNTDAPTAFTAATL